MTAEPLDSPVTEAVRTLEVRWIFPGQLATTVAGWFARFPATVESREDAYLLDPKLRGLSVKVRGGRALEVKVYLGSPGILDLAGRARGRLQDWQKWPFPCGPLSRGSADSTAWQRVGKRRRISRFCSASGPVTACAPGPCEEPHCEVELTDIVTRGQDWWTLGFEATGPADMLRSELQATAALVFATPLPGGVELGPDESRSYAEWLGQRPGTFPDPPVVLGLSGKSRSSTPAPTSSPATRRGAQALFLQQANDTGPGASLGSPMPCSAGSLQAFPPSSASSSPH
jgi:hypothetical protein